jgi:hypothetical protein
MDDEPAMVAERGLLATSDEVWNLAVRRAEVIGRLARSSVGLEAADAAAAELGVSRRLVYVLLRRWHEGEGVVSDLIPRRSSGGRGREHLPDAVEAVIRELLRTRYLTRQKRSVAAVHREIARVCRRRGLRVPSRGTIERRIAKLDPVKGVSARGRGRGRLADERQPQELYVDNAAEFKSEALRRGCEQHGIRLRYRPPGQPHYGGIMTWGGWSAGWAAAAEILRRYKGQQVVERRYGSFKGPLAVAPMCLQSNRCIAALITVICLALLIFCLVERQVRRAIAPASKLDGLWARRSPSPPGG